ncbi:hypothetical protein BX600DRAFT_554563 [Xylariales sp. PMI_506]|nr:hypothetical protein BX600DRAFT_554563 [Xylariales sp. PMI_506]
MRRTTSEAAATHHTDFFMASRHSLSRSPSSRRYSRRSSLSIRSADSCDEADEEITVCPRVLSVETVRLLSPSGEEILPFGTDTSGSGKDLSPYQGDRKLDATSSTTRPLRNRISAAEPGGTTRRHNCDYIDQDSRCAALSRSTPSFCVIVRERREGECSYGLASDNNDECDLDSGDDGDGAIGATNRSSSSRSSSYDSHRTTRLHSPCFKRVTWAIMRLLCGDNATVTGSVCSSVTPPQSSSSSSSSSPPPSSSSPHFQLVSEQPEGEEGGEDPVLEVGFRISIRGAGDGKTVGSSRSGAAGMPLVGDADSDWECVVRDHLAADPWRAIEVVAWRE